MKVRWTRRSIRLRITPSELSALLQGNAFAEDLVFPGGTLWAITVASGEETALISEAGRVVLSLSPEDRNRLAAPEAEGVYFETEDGLRYWVEKDFPCAHPRAAEALEPATEAFAAPADFDRRKQESDASETEGMLETS